MPVNYVILTAELQVKKAISQEKRKSYLKENLYIIQSLVKYSQRSASPGNKRDFHLLYRVIQNDCRGTIVQRQFHTKFGKQTPSGNSIRRWYAQFQETGCVSIPELKVRTRTAIETITSDMRNELDYRVDVCRITKGAHIEHL